MDFLEICRYTDKLKSSLDFDDIDPICKVTGAFSKAYQEYIS